MDSNNDLHLAYETTAVISDIDYAFADVIYNGANDVTDIVLTAGPILGDGVAGDVYFLPPSTSPTITSQQWLSHAGPVAGRTLFCDSLHPLHRNLHRGPGIELGQGVGFLCHRQRGCRIQFRSRQHSYGPCIDSDARVRLSAPGPVPTARPVGS